MTLVRWSEDYRVGVRMIDHDHQHLFRLINDFHNAFVEKHEHKDIARVLNALIQYAEAHFQREEELMAQEEYPGLEEHAQAHGQLIEAVFTLQAQLESHAVQLSNNTVKFLRCWLTDHIIEQDKRFFRFLLSKDRAGSA